MNSIYTLKQSYNAFLGRYNKASAYMDDNSIPLNEREVQVPAFRKIILSMENILSELKVQGIAVCEHEILGGFTL